MNKELASNIDQQCQLKLSSHCEVHS